MPQMIDEAGNIWEVGADGKPVYVGPANRGGGPNVQILGGPDPYKVKSDARAQQAADRANANSDAANARSADANALARERFIADLYSKGLQPGPNGQPVPIPGWTPPASIANKPTITAKERADAIAQYRSTVDLDRQIKGLERLYKAGPGSTSGPLGVLDYFNTPANQTFDHYSNQLRGPLKQALGMTGGENNTATEGQQNLGGYLPQSSDYDSNILEKIQSLRDLQGESAAKAIAILGGVPDANGNVTPVGQQDDQQPVAGAFGAQNPPMGGGAGGGGVQGSNILTVDGRGGGQTVARGSTRVQDNPALAGVNSRVNAMLKGGKSAGEVMSYLASVGAPIAPGLQANIQRAVEWRKKNPNSPANHYVNIDDQVIPVSGFDQGVNNVVASPGGTAFVNGVNASTAGFLANTMGERAKAGLGAINAENPKSAIGGQVVGGIAGTLGAGKILGAASRAVGGGRLGATLANPLTADAAYGATYGANMANDGERLQGAATGVLASLAGNAAGRYGVAPVARNLAQSGFGQSVARGGNTVANGFRSMLGKNPVAAPLPIPQVSPERQTILNAISGDNARQIVPMLRDAADLGLPMTLADTDAGLRSLAGAAVRRSPNAKTLAESSLGERSRGQAERLVSALDRDFMPGANIPQRSQDLIEQAKATSAPLYQQAMSNPGASSVPIDDILSTPMGQEALRRAYLEAENAKALGGQGAKAQGFDLNDQAEPFITSVPSFDTLDMMKRGFDDIVNEARDPVTGTVNMNAGQTAANAMRRSLIARIDKVNPDYASARAAYAGPAGEREALNMGAKAYSTTPDQIRMATGGMSPGKLDQYRLGYRGALDNVVDRTRLSGNPYEAVYGTPGAREKASLLFPTQEGVSRFGRQYDLERQMTQTNNQVLGNSMTAERQLADQSFDVSPGAALAIDGATMMTTGTPPIATGLSLMSRFGKDALKLGVGKKKADALAPLLLNPDAAYAAKMFDETMTDARVARYIKSAGTRKAKRKGGLFGSALATPIAVEANR